MRCQSKGKLSHQVTSGNLFSEMQNYTRWWWVEGLCKCPDAPFLRPLNLYSVTVNYIGLVKLLERKQKMAVSLLICSVIWWQYIDIHWQVVTHAVLGLKSLNTKLQVSTYMISIIFLSFTEFKSLQACQQANSQVILRLIIFSLCYFFCWKRGFLLNAYRAYFYSSQFCKYTFNLQNFIEIK